MLSDPNPGLRVRVTDPHSVRRGSLGTVVRHSPAATNAEGKPVAALTYVKLDNSIWTLPWWPEHLEEA